MKKIFYFFIFSIIFLISIHVANAEEKMSTEEAALTPTPTPIEYQLPYPGLLPDSPLYILKIFRDRIIDFLVSNPLKKAELNLLQSDKRLGSGIALIEKGKDALAESTISKGENYFSDAIIKAKEAKKQSMDTADIIRKLSLSVAKHQQILEELEKKAAKNLKDRFHILRTRAADFEKQVNEISEK